MRSLLRNMTPALIIVGVLMLLVACNSESSATNQQPTTSQSATVAANPSNSEQQPKATESMTAQADPTSPGQQAKTPMESASPNTPVNESSKPAQPSPTLNVVTTSNILADWARAVGQDRVSVSSLLPPNADPHTFQPGARDVAQIADAGLVLTVGLSLEAGWLDDLVRNAAGDPEKIIALGDGVNPIDFEEIFEDHDEEEMEEIPGRLLIGDGETGAMSVIDLEHGDVDQNAFDMKRTGRTHLRDQERTLRHSRLK